MRSSSNGVVIATKLLAFNSVITLCSEMLLKCWKTAYNIAGDNKWHWISMRMTTQERLSLGLIFVSGLFTAILFYILLPIFKQTTRLTISPYGLLPVTSLQHLDLDEVAFGAGSVIHSHLDLIPFFGKQKAAGKSDTANASAEAEALASLHMALEMKQNGKIDKALKLFKHALALSPTHPDILNHYGEFLEEQKDIVQAEHMYTRALTVCPDHLKALSNRQRTLPQVLELDENNLKRIDTKRDSLAKIPEHNSALRRMKKEAYFQHIYHTVAIEGNTMTLSQTRHIVETRMAVAGKSILEHNEILGLDAALSYVNSTLVHRIGAITVENILEIHKRVLGYADPIEAGTFRRTQVFVGAHVPPHPSDIKLLMDDFVQWLNEKETLQLHPINYAALAHYKLVFIHPFTDGNGRTARLLMNLILMQAGYPPVIIRKQDRLEYYEYLELANEGDSRPFERFIADCTERTLDVYLYATQEYPDNEIPALEGQDRKRKIILEE